MRVRPGGSLSTDSANLSDLPGPSAASSTHFSEGPAQHGPRAQPATTRPMKQGGIREVNTCAGITRAQPSSLVTAPFNTEYLDWSNCSWGNDPCTRLVGAAKQVLRRRRAGRKETRVRVSEGVGEPVILCGVWVASGVCLSCRGLPGQGLILGVLLLLFKGAGM